MHTAQKTIRLQTAPLFHQPQINVDGASGIIKNISLCTTGEAEGHEINLDQSFINDVVMLGQQYPQGLKSRFGHPNLSNEALGTYLGRFKNFRVEANRAVADLYLDDVAKKSPGGDLYNWIMDMARNNPDQFGASIVFEPGDPYQIIDGKKVPLSKRDPIFGTLMFEDESLPVYASIKTLLGADLVDEPAANPEGLFSSTQFNADKFAVRLTEFLDSNPDIWKFIDKNPEKFQPFLKRYNAYKNSSKNIKAMPKHKTFFQKLAAAFVSESGDKVAFAQIDAVTSDGQNIRVDSAGDEPAVGDSLYITDPTTGDQTVAPDGDYTISGGDFDGMKLTVVTGVITAVYDPSDQTTTTQQSSIKNYKELQVENQKLKNQINDQATALNKKIAALQKEFDDYKKKPLSTHTNVVPGDDGRAADFNETYFANRPWNKSANKAS